MYLITSGLFNGLWFTLLSIMHIKPKLMVCNLLGKVGIICVNSCLSSGAQQGIWQVAIPGALGVAISIYLSAHISEAHLNPAVTLAFAVIRRKQFHWSKVIPYIIAQIFGGFCAGIMLFVFYHDAISNFETEHNITRGEDGSELTAMLFGEYFPNPALYHPLQSNESIISLPEALIVEAWATAILVFVFFSITHPDNTTINNNKGIMPIIVGLTVACLVSIYGPLTQAGLNPARDFGPRLFAAMAGWGKIAIPGPRYGFWAYIIGPLVGGLAGGALNDLVMFCVRRCSGKQKTNDIK